MGLKKVLREVKDFWGSDKGVSDETYIGSFIMFCSLLVKACVIQNGRCCVVAGGLKSLSLICSDVGVEPK